MIFIQQKEELFKKFRQYLKSNYKSCDNFQKACIEEKWSFILKGKDIETIQNNYEKLIKEDKKVIDNNLIKIQQIVHDADNSDNFNEDIFKLEPEYSWAARIRYACILAKENVKSESDKLNKKKKAIKEFEKVKETLEIFLEDLSSQSFLNKTVFSFFTKNKEIIKQKNFKTKIEMQNENRKNFLEVLKLLINKNIDKIEKFIDECEKYPNNVLESDEILTIEQIIKKSEKINEEFEPDIKMYLNEFGFETFEMLKISSYPNFFTNTVVFAVGIMEICAGCVILFYAQSPRMIKMAKFLISEGISDIIESVKATIKGEEINLKEWGKKKAVNIIGFAFELIAFKGGEEITSSMKEKILGVLKDEVKTSIKSYVNSWATETIIKNIEKKLSQIIKDNFIEPYINPEDDKYIQFDIINQTDEYKNTILNHYKTIFDKSENLINFIGPIIELIKKLISDKNGNTEKFKEFLEFLKNFDYKGFHNGLADIYKLINKIEVNIQLNNNLSHLVLQSNKDYKKDEIHNICKELIECGAINKEGHFKTELINDKNFNQSFILKIDKEFYKCKYNSKKEISKELIKCLNDIAFKTSEKALNNKKRQIKEEIYKEIENYLQRMIKDILDSLVNKTFDKLEHLYKRYKKRKNNKKNIDVKGKINQQNDIKESVELPEMDNEAIKKSKDLNFGLIAKNCTKIGVKIGIEKIKEKLIPNLTAKILNSIKEIINELLTRLLLQFDEFFEELGTQLMILNEKKQILDKIIHKIRKVLDLFNQIKSFVSNILTTVINISKKGDLNIEEISSKIDNLLQKGIKKFLKPIDDFINFIRKGFKEIVKEEYKNIKEKGIEYYKNIKEVVGDKYNEIKDSYIINKKNILDLPDNIERLFVQKKLELQRKYEEQKENIKKSTDLKIKDIEMIDLNFMNILSNIKEKILDIIIKKIKASENLILNISSKINNLFEDIITLINQILKIDFKEFLDVKIIISKNIANFVLVILSGKYTIKINNNKIKENDIKDKLILYLQTNLEIDKNRVKKIVKHLIKEGIINILMNQINQIKYFTQDNFNMMKDYYEPAIIMINEYFILSQQNLRDFIYDNFEKIDSHLKYFIEYINKYFEKMNVFKIYFMESIPMINEFKNNLVDQINSSKNELLDHYLNDLENKLKEEYNSIIESLKLREIKEKAKNGINNIFVNGENVLFSGINSIILNPNEKEENYKSEFDKFDKLAGKTIDDKICKTASEIEEKLIKCAGNLDDKAQEFIQMIYPKDIDKKLFDYIKQKKDNVLNSEGVKKLNNLLTKFGQSEQLNKVNNLVDSIDFQKASSILDDISNISNILQPINIEKFKNDIKNILRKEILNLYEKNLENELKNLIDTTCKALIAKIEKIL